MTDPLADLNAALLRLTGQEPAKTPKPVWRPPTVGGLDPELIKKGALERADLRGLVYPSSDRWSIGRLANMEDPKMGWIHHTWGGHTFYKTREEAIEHVDKSLAAEDAKKKEQQK